MIDGKIETGKEYLNIKTGNLYMVMHRAIDCTNSRDGTPVIVYRGVTHDDGNIFVREEKEFREKFNRAFEESGQLELDFSMNGM